MRLMILPSLLAIFWCAWDGTSYGAPLRIAYSAISGAMSSLWVAQEGGYFKREGLDTELLYIGGGSLLIQAMLSGDAPFAYGPSVPVINATLRGSVDAAADGDVVNAGGDHRGGEVDRLLRRAALAIDGRRRGLDREPGLEPGVAADVDRLLAELLHAAGDDVFDLGGIDPGTLDHLGVGAGEQGRGMDVLVVALLGMAATHRGAHRLDDHYLASRELPVAGHRVPPILSFLMGLT